MPKGRKGKLNFPTRQNRAAFVPASFDATARTVDIIWTTGAEGERFEWDGEVYLESLRVDESSVRLGRLNAGAPVLDTHCSNDLDSQIGVVQRAWIENGVGHATVQLTSREERAGVVADIQAGIIRNISVGYVVHHYERVLGAEGEPDRLIATDWEPLEISFVPVPFDAGAQTRGGVKPRTFTANITDRTKGKPKMPRSIKQIRTALAEARANLVKSREIEDEAKIAEAQQALEDVSAELDEALDTLDEGAGGATGGEDGDGQPNAPPVARTGEEGSEEAERAIQAERTRISQITELARQFGFTPDQVQPMIARGLTVSQAQTSILITLAQRQQSINGSSGDNTVDTNRQKARANIEAAILHRAAPGKHKLPNEAREYRGHTMIDLAREAIQMAGGNTRGMDRSEIARVALNVAGTSQQRAAGMHSTSDFPMILGNTINRALRAAYDELEQTWRPLGRQNNFQDFRARTSVALGEASRLEKVREGGEYKYGTLPEDGNTLRAEKWGKIIAYTWEMMVNDDLGAFDRIPDALARSARQTESDVVWDLFLTDRKYSDGVNVFAAGHGNLAGTAGPLNITTLQAGRQAMRTQKGIDKKTFVQTTPRFLVVGPLNELAAYQYTSAAYVPVNNAGINPVYNTQLVVIVEPRITDYSWYLIGDGVDTFEWGYLDGEGGMITDTREGFEVDGVEVKARLVFGAGWVDYRGVFKNAGAAS